MRQFLDFGSAATGLVIGDLTTSARLLANNGAADFTGATLTECDATDLPGLYVLDAPAITTPARGKVWITATPATWAPLRWDTALLADGAHGGSAASLTIGAGATISNAGAAPALFIQSSGAGQPALHCQATNNGHGAFFDGHTDGDGIYAWSGNGASACGIHAQGQLHGLFGDGITSGICGDGTTGIKGQGYVDGPGIQGVGAGNGAGMLLTGAGTGKDIDADEIDSILEDTGTTIPASIDALPTAAEFVAALEAATVDGTITRLQAERIMFAVLAGKSSGGGTNEVTFRDAADSKARVTATVDANGNRTAITVDGA